MHHVMAFLSGWDYADLGLTLNRVLLGSFFVLARFRFFYDPSKPEGARFCNVERHESLKHKMAYCGLKNKPALWSWVAAIVEVFAGLGVVFGLLTGLSAFGLLVLLIIATRCTAGMKVREQNPVDKVDCVSCYLWRVEGLYIAQAIIIILAGPGAWSLDAVLGLR
jgi:uncharacterized membrane protein YphA (DoxX/SURF4 family)